ncbi:hypothetical protein BDV23DRAFT_152676 [Aspergillus alliaceus]|uniref:Uncharacterized protein n=1 Tax=Petromyces alliaceus TaxID=209559 RepID=A0A5N7CCJ5_PETAA|nr:hypothetical protein BDV23DRAFT_152676 [Aspergillus alliaceus]
MHHIRNPNDTDFIYDPRTQPLEDGPVLRGRCGLTTFTTAEQKGRAEHLLSAFGRDETNIPEFGVGNCQDWVVGAIGMLNGRLRGRLMRGLWIRGMRDLWGGWCRIRR